MPIHITAFAASVTFLVGSCFTAASLRSAEPLQPKPVEKPAHDAMAPIDPAANAALDWWRAIDLMPELDHAIWKLAGDGNSLLPDPTTDAFFAGNTPALSLLTLGATHDYCDWGVDSIAESGGFPEPHKTKIHFILSLVCLRARWYAERGHAEASVDDLITALRVSRLYPGCYGMTPDAMKGLDLEYGVIKTIGRIALRLHTAQRQRLLLALPGLPPALSFAKALENERAVAHRLLDRLLSEREDRRKKMLGMFWGEPEEFSRWDQFSDANLRSWFNVYQSEVDHVQKLLSLPPANILREVDIYESDSDSDPFSYIFMCGSQTLGPSEVRLVLMRDQLAAAFAYIDGGESAFATHLNALDGQPFSREGTPGGFRVSALCPGKGWSAADLIIGEPPPKADKVRDRPAPSPLPGDF